MPITALMCFDFIVNLLKRVIDYSFLFLNKTLVFLFMPLLNLGTQISYPKNGLTNFKWALHQPLAYNLRKLRNIRKISSYGGQIAQWPVDLQEIRVIKHPKIDAKLFFFVSIFAEFLHFVPNICLGLLELANVWT